ncbi:MAG: porin [Rhodocyclaceae bacterium]|nr:porin [Rhodocyclaceae bacterium]
MQKKLIALAIAGLASSAAFAQSNVTIYGIVDVAYTHSSSGSSSTSGIDSGGWSSSRMGFRGTEDLGDGLKALFTLEYGLVARRESWCGDNNGVKAWIGRLAKHVRFDQGWSAKHPGQGMPLTSTIRWHRQPLARFMRFSAAILLPLHNNHSDQWWHDSLRLCRRLMAASQMQ